MRSETLLSRWHLTGHDRRKLRTALTAARVGRHARRLQAVLLVAQGYAVQRVAQMTVMSRQSVYNLLRRYQRRHNPADLLDRPRSGRPRTIPPETNQRMRAALKQSPHAFGYNANTWTSGMLGHHLQHSAGLTISPQTVRRRLRAMRWRWKRPRHSYKHPEPHKAQQKGGSNAGSNAPHHAT